MTLTFKQAAAFEFTQVTPSDTWVIAHNLDIYPIIDVYVDDNGEQQKIIPLTVEYTDANTCTVTFSNPESGLAILA
jgi:hypothetical protein